MSALWDNETGFTPMEVETQTVELPTELTEAWHLAQGTPEQAVQAEISPKILFLASQIGMMATEDWRVRADWVSVYLKAVGQSHDY